MARKMAVVLCLSMACGAVLAVTPPAPVDGVVTLDVASGTTTYDAAISSEATKVIKIGAGEALLTVASPDFVGTVEVQVGTLSISDYNALGAGGMPVTVTSGASFMLKGRRSTSRDERLYSGKITIAGTGVNGAGAFAFNTTDTSSKNCDFALPGFELSGDATIKGNCRWGFAGGRLDLNGHRLVINNSTYFYFGAVTHTAGEVEFAGGTMIIEGSGNYSAVNSDTLKFIKDNGVSVYLYAVPKAIPVSWDSYGGLIGQTGQSPCNRLTGPIRVYADGALSGATFLAIEGPVYANGHAINKYQDGETVYGGPFYGPEANSSLNVYRGIVTITGNVARTAKKQVTVLSQEVAQNQTAMLDLAGGTFDTDKISIGSGGCRGILRIRNGAEMNSATSVMLAYDTKDTFDPVATLALEDGALKAGTTITLGDGNVASPNPNAFLLQRGGFLSITNITEGSMSFLWGTSIAHITGGTNSTITTKYPTTNINRIFAGGRVGAQACISVEGSNTVMVTDQVMFGCEGASNLVCAIRDGGTLKAKRFVKNSAMTGSNGLFTFIADGGVLMPIFGYAWSGYTYKPSNPMGSDSSMPRMPDHSVLLEGGVVFDTTECYKNGTGETVALEVPFVFESPSGGSIASISLPSDSSFEALKFYEPAFFEIEGEGYGAVAYADADRSTLKLKPPTIASPGFGYGAGTRVYLRGPSARYECSFTLAEHQCGPLVKRGPATLKMTIPGNTYTGGTHVVSGSVSFENNSFPQGTPVVLGDADGNSGTLEFVSSPAVTLSSLGGKGAVTGYSSLTISNVVLDARRLASGGTATVACSGAVSFADGATLKIENPECLASAESQRYDIMTATSMSGAVTLDALDESVAGKWRLQNMGDRLRLVKVRGFVITVD